MESKPSLPSIYAIEGRNALVPTPKSLSDALRLKSRGIKRLIRPKGLIKLKQSTKDLYPSNWQELAKALIALRGNQCENCLRGADGAVVLTVHHLDHDPSNNYPTNLKVLCQACHLDQERASLKSFGRVGNHFEAVRAGQITLPGFETPRKLMNYLGQS